MLGTPYYMSPEQAQGIKSVAAAATFSGGHAPAVAPRRGSLVAIAGGASTAKSATAAPSKKGRDLGS